MSRQAEQKESQRLTELADGQQSGIEDDEAVKEHAEEGHRKQLLKRMRPQIQTIVQPKRARKIRIQKKQIILITQRMKKQGRLPVLYAGEMICSTEQNPDTYSYMAVLQKLLTDNGYNLTVVNKTLQGGGTLSMMKMAEQVMKHFRAILRNISRLQTVHS